MSALRPGSDGAVVPLTCDGGCAEPSIAGRSQGDDRPLDRLVARFVDLTRKNLPTAPVLAVEVLSASRRLIDLELKRAAYERMGTASYWIIDPEVPRLLVLELDANRRYVEVARMHDDQVFEAHRPFPVRVVPADLLGRFRAR